LVPLVDFVALLPLGGLLREHPGDGYTVALVIQYIPAFLIVILATHNTLRLLPAMAAPASGAPSRSARAGGWLSSLGGALSLVGHFAPWALLTGAFLLLSECGGRTSHDAPPSGADLAWQNDLILVGGLVIVGAALAAVVIGLRALRRQPPPPVALFLLVVTLVSAGVLIYDAALLIAGAFPFDGAPAIAFVQFEPGFWASAAGAALSLVGAMVLLVVSRRDPTAASAHATTREGDATEQGPPSDAPGR
jgi:hypothetical protein